jgi:hypothetical protein
VKTSLKLLRPEDVWQPKMGPPGGNRNALKTGRHTKKLRAMRSEIAHWRRTTNALIREGKEELSLR